MAKSLHLDILPQPDETTCGPTCLHAVFRYFDDELPLAQVIRETPKLEEGGTLAVLLGCHALRKGYKATIYTYNLTVFDPSWFYPPTETLESEEELAAFHKRRLIERLHAQLLVKADPKLHTASRAYIQFLELGGVIAMEDLKASLVRRFLKRDLPILTGLSATYLYGTPREFGDDCKPDDVRGYAVGHFVVLHGYDKEAGTVSVADPYLPNPLGEEHHYDVKIDRLLCAIMLGVLTYDANLLVIEPADEF
ncbi:hypothetical protein [Blastopirellula marina]|uniref:Peptidase C39-like domain-containing protein n=1 Tax=Blastopirellula marina DSM 3645 TaxID=314230 RepID=A3ZWT6_9BACT|nr:hypothetical protein [Blastopirellula marina]EAQ79060.1 hypothetical protein DSM3645_13890 [Blastopirellula marina DSM 3645]